MAQEYSLNRTSVRHDESLHRKRATIFVVPLAGIPAHRISAWPLSGAWRLEGGGGSCRTFRAIAPREEGGEVSLRIWRGHGVVFRAGAPAEAGRVAAFSLTFVLSFSEYRFSSAGPAAVPPPREFSSPPVAPHDAAPLPQALSAMADTNDDYHFAEEHSLAPFHEARGGGGSEQGTAPCDLRRGGLP